MTIVMSTLAIAFAAVCVWLGRRTFNRRERWAKMTLAAVVGVPVLYVLSFGPACWATARAGGQNGLFEQVFWPIGWLGERGPSAFLAAVKWYAIIGSPPGSKVLLPSNFESSSGFVIE